MIKQVKVAVSLIALLFLLGGLPYAASQPDLEVLLCNQLLKQLEKKSSWEAAQSVGVKGIEVWVESDLSCPELYVGEKTPYRLDSVANARKLKADAAAHNLITPIVVAPLTLELQAQTKLAPAWAKQLVATVSEIGATFIYFPIVTKDFTQTTLSDRTFVETATGVLLDLASHGKKHGVAVGLENLSVYWNRGEILRNVLQQVSKGDVGLCLDPINFYWYGHPRSRVSQLVQEFIPYAQHFHAKNVAHPLDQRERQRKPGWKYMDHSVPVQDGDLDFERFIGQLFDAGYTGYISIEDDSLEKYPVDERVEILRTDVAYIRGLVDSYRKGSVDTER